MPVNIISLKTRIYNYFLENYDDEELAKNKSISVAKEIITLVDLIDQNFNLNNILLTKQIHTLKHLLLYADLDDISDLCQYLELNVRLGVLNHELKVEIISKIVKYI